MGNFRHLTNQRNFPIDEIRKILEFFLIIDKQQVGGGYADNFMQVRSTFGLAAQQWIINVHLIKLVELNFYFRPNTEDSICDRWLFP